MKLSMSDDYNENSRSQSSLWCLARELGLFDEVLKGIPRNGIPPCETKAEETKAGESLVRVVEFGCATGGNSLGPLAFISNNALVGHNNIGHHRNRKCNLLEILLVDRPENHWAIVAETVTPEAIVSHHRANCEEGAESEPEPPENANPIDIDIDARFDPISMIRIRNVPKCFYETCAPEASVDVAYSFAATHWMKNSPKLPSIECSEEECPPLVCHAMFPTCLANNCNRKSLERWTVEAQNQLRAFAASRNRELRVGGRFLGSFCCLEEGQGSTPWSRLGKLVRDTAIEKLRNDQDESLSAPVPSPIAKSLLSGNACTLPIAFRTKAELTEAFAENKGWKVWHCDYALAEDPLRETFRKEQKQLNICYPDDHDELTLAAADLKRRYVQATMRSWKAACLPGLVGSMLNVATAAKKEEDDRQVASHAEVIQIFWESVCDDCVEKILSNEEDSSDMLLEDQYNLGIPTYFVLAEKQFCPS